MTTINQTLVERLTEPATIQELDEIAKSLKAAGRKLLNNTTRRILSGELETLGVLGEFFLYIRDNSNGIIFEPRNPFVYEGNTYVSHDVYLRFDGSGEAILIPTSPKRNPRFELFNLRGIGRGIYVIVQSSDSKAESDYFIVSPVLFKTKVI